MKIVKFICKKCGTLWIGYTDEKDVKDGEIVKTICSKCNNNQ